ncbi:MAG: hypothetical protein QMD21_01080 [Candidatus Thermoplasmatota archaeon]|nr:hypothetical protein [Candidatus Thermoplasmatota archaeon]MDI6855365.1 hypothetical protein [Candidatus Thermoplasmatota archaeon]
MKAREQKLYDFVISKITKIREQGEAPKSDILSLDNFVCDLCKGVIQRAKITQCPFCGRWICRAQCWDSKERGCLACSGVIKLCRESVKPGKAIKTAEPEVRKGKGRKLVKLKGIVKKVRWKKK